MENSIICYFVMSNLILLLQDRIKPRNKSTVVQTIICINLNKINYSTPIIKLREYKN